MSTLPHHVALVSDTAAVGFSEVSAVAAALQKQATRDFGPIWQVNATVNAFGALESVPVDYWPVIIRDDIDSPGAAGYHTDESSQPFSVVQADDQWQLTASHEVLEMLADPFGSRTIAGSPPPQAPQSLAGLRRVTYLLEVCDPCEDTQFAYGVNGLQLSDFITPHYYHPPGGADTLFSFRGNIRGPHAVADGGYVSFGNPVTNEWYQITVANGQTQLRELGKLNRNGRSLRETIDEQVRHIRRKDYYRIRKPLAARAVSVGGVIAESSGARARSLREFIGRL
jgi:hypothetical protein